jgi:hypothetical protein
VGFVLAFSEAFGEFSLIAVGFWLLVGIACYLFLVRERYALR